MAAARLKAECCEFKDGDRRIMIKLFIDDEEVVMFPVARRHAAILMRQINGL